LDAKRASRLDLGPSFVEEVDTFAAGGANTPGDFHNSQAELIILLPQAG